MNPWKQTVLLANYNLFWEPIMCKKSKGNIIRLFDYNNQVFKKIINSNITYFNDTIIKKKFQFINNIQILITNEECILKQKKLIKDNKLDIIEPSSFESLDSKSRILLNNLPSGKIVNELTHVSETRATDELFIKLDDISNTKLTKAKLTKMKLEELNNLSKKFNITITKQNPTKAFLIELILAKISNENT
jgi:hypothetical protein